MTSGLEERRDTDRAPDGRFCPVSLGDWLELCKTVGIPHIPAEQVATILKADWLIFDEPGEHQVRLDDAYEEAMLKLKRKHILRYDFGTTQGVKSRLNRGEPRFHSDMAKIILDDPNAYTTLEEFPREEVPVWQRPWTEALVATGYPVQYRAFVQAGRVAGISSYYPQRPLHHRQEHLEEVLRLCDAIIARVETPFLWNTHIAGDKFLRDNDPDGIHFTADFMATPGGDLLLVEGGPPHGMGADPCCFLPGEVQGIALKDRNNPDQQPA